MSHQPPATEQGPAASDPSDADADPRVFAAVQEYLRELEAGRRPSRREFVNRHPEIAGELSACLDGLAFVHSAANEMAAGDKPAKPAAPDIDPETAQPLGDFRLIRQIGRGGMGVVYEAVQLSLGRRVALKVLPLAAALDARHLERFRNEASAAAQLHHANIVPVYAVGCERSVHFYAMQLIEGKGLDEVIRELRELGGRPEPEALKGADAKTVFVRAGSGGGSGGSGSGSGSGSTTPTAVAAEPPAVPAPDAPAVGQSLSTLRSSRSSAYARSVARLGLQVAEALDYAHRMGIVHRDIKPANLLLDVKGALWVTDFGLAQFYADTNLTRSGDLVGTLRYMSPEQASGRAVVLDQRTDVYSLGVTLYELLTLERAYPGTTHETLLLQIAHDEPRPPRSIDRTIPRELELILAKAYAKDPADRYPSAGAMADDLRRFLRDEPIQARAPSVLNKAVKWTRRHKAVAVSAVTVLALSAVGLSIATVLIARAQGKTSRALALQQQKATEAERQRERAERSGHEARQAVQFFANIAAREMDKPEYADVRREMLEEALRYYETFLDEQGDNPAVSEELAAARSTSAAFLEVYTSLDAFARAEGRVGLLNIPEVQHDLGLSHDRAQEVGRALGALVETPPTREQDRAMVPDDRQRKYADRVRAIESAMQALLGEATSRRLIEIQRQVRGMATFGEPEVAAALGLTREQRSKIAILQADVRGPRGGRGAEQQAAHVKAVLALLTPAQRDRWGQLIGRPFQGDVKPGGYDRGGPEGRRPPPEDLFGGPPPRRDGPPPPPLD